MPQSASATRQPHKLLALAAVALAVIGAAIAAGPASAAQTQSPRIATTAPTADGTLLAVSVKGEARRLPDIAHLSTGVVTQAADPQAAMAANAAQMTRVIEAIKAAGIEPADIRTRNISLNPQYRYTDGQPPTITAYRASNTVEITVPELDRVGRIIDALVSVGANQINGPTFEVDDKQAAFDEARRAALEKARTRARKYADALGMRVRRIVRISEGRGFNPPRPVAMMAMARAESAPTTPVAPGESTLTVTLDVAFELGD